VNDTVDSRRVIERWKDLKITINQKCYVVIIHGRVVLVTANLKFSFGNNMTIHDQLGNDLTATTEAVNNAITEHGHYTYFGNVNCWVTRLEVWMERAPKDQRGKNDHL
jgi:cytochrome b involved in lipid metabolism